MLISPARNPSIFRRRFRIRLWYPSQHLLRQNPLPRSQFGSRRRFPSAASQRQTVVRLACRGQRRRGPWIILVQPRRDRKAALKLMRKRLKKQGVTPATIVTDKLGSYTTAYITGKEGPFSPYGDEFEPRRLPPNRMCPSGGSSSDRKRSRPIRAFSGDAA